MAMRSRTTPRYPSRLHHARELPGRWFWIPLFGFLLAGFVMPFILLVFEFLGFELSGWMIWSTILMGITAVWAFTRKVLSPRRTIRHARRQ